MTLSGRQVGIIGAGVAGLTSAMTLAARGAAVTVCEEALAFEDVGAGIQLSPNALRVFAALGCDPAAMMPVTTPRRLSLRDLRGGWQIMGYHQPPGYIQVHRADLIGWLAETAAGMGADIRLGQAARPGEWPTTVIASGVHTARPGPGAAFTGQVAWRALIPCPSDFVRDPGTRVYIGPGRHLVLYPLRNATLLNIVAVEEGQDWTEEGWQHPGDPDALRRAFSDACDPVQAVLASVTRARRWALRAHTEVRMVSDAGAPLVGDAAQAMLPFVAQGAAMAIEDAHVLARAMEIDDLDAYARMRAARRSRVARAAIRNGRIFHEARPWWLPFQRVGMWGLGRVSPGLIQRQYAWIYDADVTEEPLA
ncbi:MAG: FAD-dependent monooxygenase [Pseudomonadota bacterium]